MGRRISPAVRAAGPPPDGVALWLTGQAGVVLKGAGQVIFVHPYLSDALERATRGTPKAHVRLYPPAVTAEEVDWADWVLITHRQLDHMDPPALLAIAEASPQARFVVPCPEWSRAESIGVPAPRIVARRRGNA